MYDLKHTEMIIYKITNLINGKCYIGQSQKPFNTRYSCKGQGAERVMHHHEKQKQLGRSYNKHLLNSMQVHGIENFTVEILEQCETVAQLNSREKYYIKFFNCCDANFGYNCQIGGNSRKQTNKMKKQRRQQKVHNMKNEQTFLYENGCADYCEVLINRKILYHLPKNSRMVYITILLLSQLSYNTIQMKQLKQLIPRTSSCSRENMIERALIRISDIINLQYSINDGVLYFTVDNEQNTTKLMLHTKYVVDYHQSLLLHINFKDDLILIQCKKCGRYHCVEKKACNTKYCNDCKNEVNKEKSKEYNRKKRKKEEKY